MSESSRNMEAMDNDADGCENYPYHQQVRSMMVQVLGYLTYRDAFRLSGQSFLQ